MYRKKKKRRGGGSKKSVDKYPMIYGYYDEDDSIYYRKKKKKNKIAKIMGFTQLQLDALCDSVPLRTDIRVKRTFVYNFK